MAGRIHFGLVNIPAEFVVTRDDDVSPADWDMSIRWFCSPETAWTAVGPTSSARYVIPGVSPAAARPFALLAEIMRRTQLVAFGAFETAGESKVCSLTFDETGCFVLAFPAVAGARLAAVKAAAVLKLHEVRPAELDLAAQIADSMTVDVIPPDIYAGQAGDGASEQRNNRPDNIIDLTPRRQRALDSERRRAATRDRPPSA